MFWPIYLSFTNPIWSEWIRLGKKGSIHLAILSPKIFQSTLNNVMGHQPVSSDKLLSYLRNYYSSLGNWEASFLKSFMIRMKESFIKLFAETVFTRSFIFLKRKQDIFSFKCPVVFEWCLFLIQQFWHFWAPNKVIKTYFLLI